MANGQTGIGDVLRLPASINTDVQDHSQLNRLTCRRTMSQAGIRTDYD